MAFFGFAGDVLAGAPSASSSSESSTIEAPFDGPAPAPFCIGCNGCGGDAGGSDLGGGACAKPLGCDAAGGAISICRGC